MHGCTLGCSCAKTRGDTLTHTQDGCLLREYTLLCSLTNTHTTHMSSPGAWEPNVRQAYGDSPHDPLPNHVEQTETVASATTSHWPALHDLLH